ncbi:MAG: hypothetical protein FWD73_03015 [Polyangiaceae bacterium]|nr:hypothetical protein [Polyangiaceae bacterium]
MTRALVIAILLAAGLFVASPGCSEQGVGDPCTPEQEYNVDFNGFSVNEVNVESKSFQCRTRVCLVNHFQGRVSCPYGQNADGTPTSGTQGCTVPGTDTPITGAPNDPTTGATVKPQCVDRTTDRAVYCSCRCADINGNKPSDQIFCKCPDGFSCTQLVTSIGVGNEGLTGSYCIKNGTAYDPNSVCPDTCDATRTPCP